MYQILCFFPSLLLLEEYTMATPQLFIHTKKVHELIVDVITDLKRKHKRGDCERIHKEIVKIADFSNISKGEQTL